MGLSCLVQRPETGAVSTGFKYRISSPSQESDHKKAYAPLLIPGDTRFTYTVPSSGFGGGLGGGAEVIHGKHSVLGVLSGSQKVEKTDWRL